MAESLVVRLLDAHGNGLPGHAVSWTTLTGSVAPANSVTDANGRAATEWTLGPAAGSQSVGVTAAGLAGSFTATALPGSPTSLNKLLGDGQTGTAGVALPESLVVLLLDPNGNGVPGRTVTWSAVNGSVNPTASVTDANGRAATRWTLGSSAGTQSATVTAAGLTAGFTATAVPGVAGTLTLIAGDAQSGIAGTALAESLVVRVTDANGNGVAGRTVNWTTSSGSPLPASGLTDASGLVATSWTLGPTASAQTLTATSPGLTGSVTFGATALPGLPAAMVKIAGDSQVAPAGSVVPESLVVRVADVNGKPVAGRTVNWATSFGSVLPASSVSDANGLAGTSSTLAPTTGPQSVSVTTAGIPGSITFVGRGTAGAPTTLSKLLGDTQSGTAGTVLPESLVVRLVDANGNGVAGRTVTWTPSAGTVSPTSAVTNASGRAATSWTLGPNAGSQGVTVAAAGLTASFTATANAGVPGSIALVAGGNQSGTVGTVLPESLVVRVEDANGNGIAGRTVDWTTSFGSVAPPSSTTDANGLAATSWTLGTTAGAQSVTAASPGLTGVVVTFSATALPGPPVTLTRISGDGQSGIGGAILPESLVVRLTDVNGNGVSGRTVNWTTSSGNLSSSSTVTDATGRSAIRWTLGSLLGAQTASAAVGGLQANFSATVVSLPGTMHLAFSTYRRQPGGPGP